MCAWVCRRIPRSALVFSSPLQILLKERVFRLGLLLGLWLAARLAFLFVLFVICSGRGKRVGNLARPTTHLFFFFSFCLSNQPTLSGPSGLKRLQSQAVSKVAGGLKKLHGPPQVPPKPSAWFPDLLRPTA